MRRKKAALNRPDIEPPIMTARRFLRRGPGMAMGMLTDRQRQCRKRSKTGMLISAASMMIA